ncbi:MAG: hypothetical protein OEM00_04460 [Burkholderiaceae bacterium]|nr:hypothetical protein [Burkholderiaceae bacterium]MDH3460221.1 hypothetical protein [Burkholderiaceae bacterium]
MQTSPQQAVDHYLRTGAHDELSCNWPGSNFLASVEYADAALRNALISTVRQRTVHAVVPAALASVDVIAFTRAKVAPMVRGLFPGHEQKTVLDVLKRSIVFLTPTTIDAALRTTPWLYTAWDLANLYLVSCAAQPLSENVRPIVGLSAETPCFVATDYFNAPSRFDDFVVHEAAHVFHNCKRSAIGLSATPRREWLLDIDFPKRETFAYACEGYSRILELGNSPAARRVLLSEIEAGPVPPDDRVESDEYIDILREAVASRNGWKRILHRCSAAQGQRRRTIGSQ